MTSSIKQTASTQTTQSIWESISSTSTASAAAGAGFIDAGLAYVGMKAFLSSVSNTFNCASLQAAAQTALASISAVLASVIEYEIYKQNFDGAAEYFSDGIKHHIVQNMLIKMHNGIVASKKTADSPAPEKQNTFYLTYREYYIYLDQLQKKHDKDEEDKKEIAEYKEKLYLLEENVLSYLETNTTGSNNGNDKEQLIADIDNFFVANNGKAHYAAELTHKKYFAWGASIAIAIGAAGTFMMSIASSNALTAVLLAAIGISNPCGLLIAIAALSTVFFLMVTYKIVMDIICRDLINVYYEKLTHSWKEASTTKRIGLAAVVTLFIGFSFFATVATGGTWWATGLAGQVMLFNAASVSIEALVRFTIILSIIFTVFFEIKNMLMTLEQYKHKEFAAIPKEICDFFSDRFHKVFVAPFSEEKQSLLTSDKTLLFKVAVVFCCLLHIIVNLSFAIWEPFVFLGHCFSEALTIDHAWLFSPMSITIVMFFECILTDLHIMNNSEQQKLIDYDTPIDCSAAETHQHSDLAFQILTFALTVSLILPLTYLLDAWIIQDKSFEKACETVKNKINDDQHGHHFEKHAHEHTTTLKKPQCYGSWRGLFDSTTSTADKTPKSDDTTAFAQ
jgi:hypothetical protein